MKRFIPREKLGKKARKQLDSEQRATWAFSPVTKKVESRKLYNRKRKSHDRYDDYGMGFLRFYHAHKRTSDKSAARPLLMTCRFALLLSLHRFWDRTLEIHCCYSVNHFPVLLTGSSSRCRVWLSLPCITASRYVYFFCLSLSKNCLIS